MPSKKKRKTPLCGEGKGDELANLLPKSTQGFHGSHKQKRRERFEESPQGFGTETKSRVSDEECEHAVTSFDAKRSHMCIFVMKEMGKEGEVTKKKTLGDFLREYESQTQAFRDHLTFMDFFKSKVKGSQQKDRFVLSTFEGSPTCSAKAWVEELKTMLQQHKVSKGDAIRFAALHFRGKTYAWWIFESCSLKDANTSSYFRFIEAMME